jgi:hypothetical protein
MPTSVPPQNQLRCGAGWTNHGLPEVVLGFLSTRTAQLFEIHSEALLTEEKVETPITAPTADAR